MKKEKRKKESNSIVLAYIADVSVSTNPSLIYCFSTIIICWYWALPDVWVVILHPRGPGPTKDEISHDMQVIST